VAKVHFLDTNGTHVKALADVRVRQALNCAIDRQAIAKNLFQGAVEPTAGTVTLDYSNPALTNMYPYDLANAKQLLAAAGYPHGFTFGIVAASSGTLTGIPLMQAIAQYWANIGSRSTSSSRRRPRSYLRNSCPGRRTCSNTPRRRPRCSPAVCQGRRSTHTTSSFPRWTALSWVPQLMLHARP
jgi:peptide/nickel transport system substrate-binding protein